MYKTFNKKFSKDFIVIQPGEFYVVNTQHEAVATVLGSCISVCLMDPQNRVGGMNHFMLPGDFRNEEIFNSKSGRYGMFAMESLINEMMKKGGKKENFIAKIFGGGHVLNFRKSDGNIPESNIHFARTFLSFEEIPIVAQDVGGNVGRKVIYIPSENGRVLVKRLPSQTGENFIKEESQYKADVFNKKKLDKSGGVTIFKNE